MRDAHKTRCYHAEDSAAWSARAEEPLTPEQALAWLRQLAERARFRAAFADVIRVGLSTRAIRVEALHRQTPGADRAAGMRAGRLRMHGRTLPRWIILHEVAHYFNTTAGEPSHGRAWRLMYLRLVRAALGVADWRALRAAFVAHKLTVTRARVLSPARRRRLRVQMTALRTRMAAKSHPLPPGT